MIAERTEQVSRETFSDLRVILRDRKFNDKNGGCIRIEGLHPRCGGRCTIISEWDEDKGQQCSVIKPHGECEPVACLDSRKAVCSSSVISLRNGMLDSNKVAL